MGNKLGAIYQTGMNVKAYLRDVEDEQKELGYPMIAQRRAIYEVFLTQVAYRKTEEPISLSAQGRELGYGAANFRLLYCGKAPISWKVIEKTTAQWKWKPGEYFERAAPLCNKYQLRINRYKKSLKK